MPLKKTAILAALLCATFVLSAPAHAKDEDGKSAKTLYEEGVDLANQKRLPEAEAKFLEAWAIQKSYDVAANLGEMNMQQGRPAEAAVYLTYALQNFPASGNSEKREWLEKRLNEARAQVVSLTVAVNVPGAEVRINGKLAGTAPLAGEVFAAPGDCTVEVTAPDYLPQAHKIKVVAGGAQKLQIELELPKKSPLPGVVGGSVGVAALVTGAVLYLVSTSKYDEAQGLRDEIVADKTANHCVEGKSPNAKCAALKSAAEQSDALYAPGLALMVGGALLSAAGGAYLGVVLRSPSSQSSAKGKGPALTSIGVRGSGLVLQGTF